LSDLGLQKKQNFIWDALTSTVEGAGKVCPPFREFATTVLSQHGVSKGPLPLLIVKKSQIFP